VRGGHGEGGICGGGFRQVMGEERKKRRRNGTMEKVTRDLDRSLFISGAAMKGHATVHQIVLEILDQRLDWLQW
jgi:hypothetical protein